MPSYSAAKPDEQIVNCQQSKIFPPEQMECPGYTYDYLFVNGGDSFAKLKDTQWLPLPVGAQFSDAYPICSIYSYRTHADDDLGWRCNWEEYTCETDDSVCGGFNEGETGYLFTLDLLYSDRYLHEVEAVAAVIDTGFLYSADFWPFYVSDEESDVGPTFNGSYDFPIISNYLYDTNLDDDFIFGTNALLDDWKTPRAWVDNGNSGSAFAGYTLAAELDLWSGFYICQWAVEIQSGDYYTWSSRNNDPWRMPLINPHGNYCNDLDYVEQEPLIFPALVRYGDTDDMEARVENVDFREQDSIGWVEMDVIGDYGGRNAWVLLTVIGIRALP